MAKRAPSFIRRHLPAEKGYGRRARMAIASGPGQSATVAMGDTMARVYRDVLAVPGARALIGASAASQIGNWLYNAVLLGYVYSATHSVGWVGAATVGRLVPYVLLGPLGGAIADRYRRRNVLLAGDTLRILLMAAIAATVAAAGPAAVLIGLTALVSAAGCAERPATLALLPRLVGETRLGPANMLLHTVQDLGVLIGPAIGAILLGVAPAWVAFAASGATFALSALLTSTMRPGPAPVAGPRSGAGQLVGGLTMVRRTPFAMWLIVIVAMVEFTYGAQTVQLVVYATHSLRLGQGGYGVLLTAAGVGGVLSALSNGRLSISSRVSAVVVVTGLLACVTQLAYAGQQVLAVALAVTVIGNAALVSCKVVGETALSRIAPREGLGRVIGIFDTVSVAAMIAGAVLAPVLVALTSLRASLLILGAAAVAVTLVAGLGLRGLDALSAKRADALASRVKILQGLRVTAGRRRSCLSSSPRPRSSARCRRASTSWFRGRRRTRSTRSPKDASWCTGTARPSSISAPATTSVSGACSTRPRGTPPSPRRWRPCCCGWKAPPCSTRLRRPPACGPRSS
jgi:MFS family permease